MPGDRFRPEAATGILGSFGQVCPRPWENASEVWVDGLRFPGARADADRPTGASSLSEAIRL